MTVTTIADEVQAQVLNAVQVVQENVVTALEWVGDQAETHLPEQILNLTAHLPQVTEYVDRGFETAEQWLRSQRDFASKVVDTVKTAAPTGVAPKTVAPKTAAPTVKPKPAATA